MHLVEETDLSETFFVGIVSLGDVKSEHNEAEDSERRSDYEDTWIVSLPIQGTLVTQRIDTGAQANLISMTEISAMKPKPNIIKKRVPLKDYNGKNVESNGQCRLTVTIKHKDYDVLFNVVSEGRESLLGGMTSKRLNVVERVYHISCAKAASGQRGAVDSIVQHYEDVFKGLGCLPCTYSIQLKEDAKPVIDSPRRVPAPLKDLLKK